MATIVQECTDRKDLPKAERKRQQILAAPTASLEVIMERKGEGEDKDFFSLMDQEFHLVYPSHAATCSPYTHHHNPPQLRPPRPNRSSWRISCITCAIFYVSSQLAGRNLCASFSALIISPSSFPIPSLTSCLLPHRTEKRRIEYFKWAKKVTDGCQGACPPLEEELSQLYLEVLGPS